MADFCQYCSQPDFEFVINVVVAKALGIDIPSKVLARTDEIIE